MKTRFSVSEIFHVFAAQKQGMGATQESKHVSGVPFVSFSGNVLSSYRAPIARIVPEMKDSEGCPVALVTSRNYSITTTGHCSAARRALSHFRVFIVPDVTAHFNYEHEKNLSHIVASYRGEVSRAKRAKSLYRCASQEWLGSMAQDARDFAALFGLPDPALDATRDYAEIVAHHAAKDTPEARAKREKARARRAVSEQAKAERQAQERAERIEAWRKGGAPLLPRDLETMPHALLRVSGDTLQTSHGASVPLEDAKRVFAFITRGLSISENMPKETSYNARLSVGRYSLDQVFANGDFRAGCHKITYEEAARIAQEIGFTPDMGLEG